THSATKTTIAPAQQTTPAHSGPARTHQALTMQTVNQPMLLDVPFPSTATAAIAKAALGSNGRDRGCNMTAHAATATTAAGIATAGEAPCSLRASPKAMRPTTAPNAIH